MAGDLRLGISEGGRMGGEVCENMVDEVVVVVGWINLPTFDAIGRNETSYPFDRTGRVTF